ncbi:hypothetical protein EAF00_005613 [Botryotinia globosa]|nr:hypothetical protein EAF00_005613 [Botryotinia globosa]
MVIYNRSELCGGHGPKELILRVCSGTGSAVSNVLDSSFAKPTDRNEVIGIGGIGHLAILLASKMGCERLLYYTISAAKDASVNGSLDRLIAAAPVWKGGSAYLPFSAPKAKIFAIVTEPENLMLLNMPLLLNVIARMGEVHGAEVRDESGGY